MNNSRARVSKLSVADIKKSVDSLKTGLGFYGIHSNHFKYLSDFSLTKLRSFLKSCFIHRFIPSDILKTVVRPVIKKKLGSRTDSTNYREIMISSNFYKVFEYCILQFIKKYCRISPLQFWYRENTNTLMPVAILKECISKFYNDGNTVYACFLDLSKAFERISHEQLLSKLACTDLPEFVINFLSNSSVSININGFFFPTAGASSGVWGRGASCRLICLPSI